MSRRKKKKSNKPTTESEKALNSKIQIAGESDLHFENLPAKIKEVTKLSPDAIQNSESMAFVELQQVKYYVEQFGDDVPRIAKLVGIKQQRAKKLIDDVYNIVWGIEGRSNADQRRRHKKRHMALLDRLVENGLDYIEEGYKGRQLSPNEFKMVAGEIRSSLSDKAKMHGIGNTVIFEQFNTQNNINMSPAQKGIEQDKDVRFLLTQLEKTLTEADEAGIIEAEIVK